MTIKKEFLLLGLLLFFSAFIRFYQLGYSHFYGDEIKTLYLRKDVSALNFLMDQRKGPGQFMLSWVAEKVSGGYSEFWIRFPYAVAGTLLVLVFYLFVKQNFGINVGMFSAILFSLNGFYIAFSRTAQYQVLYMLFGFLCLVFAKKYVTKNQFWLLLVSAVCFALSLLCHYDALFFLLPLFFITSKKSFLKTVFLGLSISLLFYIPNIYLGFFETNTFGYISMRLVGENYLKNNSLYTMLVYSPFYLYLISLFGLFWVAVLKVQHYYKSMLILWTATPFLVFQFLISNPGTHIHNFMFPAIIVAGLGLNYIYSRFSKVRYFLLPTILVLITLFYLVQVWVYVPVFNKGYPWRVNRASNEYHLYLYGFPYNRGWDKVGDIFKTYKGIRNFYTNDNETVAEYYLYGLPYIAPGHGFLPQYYVQVDFPQELKQKPYFPLDSYIEVWIDDESGTKVYKKIG